MNLIPTSAQWQDGKLCASHHKDVYFSHQGGLDESRYVFLQPNGLPLRFSQGEGLRIFETGFGVGRNFLTTFQAWAQHPSPKAPLHYISVEHAPLEAANIAAALSVWPELKPYLETLLSHYPALEPGRYDLDIVPGLRLSLLWGEANAWLSQIHEPIDAWYLDGFAPKWNPELWQLSLYSHMARLSGINATASTYSAAGRVRRGLEMAGFTVQRPKGFGSKKEMLSGLRLIQPV